MSTRKSDHPLARLLSEFERAASSDLQAARSDRERASAARKRIADLEADGKIRKTRRIELSKAYAEGQATAAELEEALASEQRHADTLRAAREGLNAVVKSDSGASARLERKRADAVERMAPAYREHLEARLADLAATLRADTERFLAPVQEADEALARALAQTLPGVAGLAGRVESALRDAEAADARRSGPREYHPVDGREEPVPPAPSAADILRQAAERRGRVDATSAGRPPGVEAGRIMQ